MNGFTYDAGALIAAERRNPIMLALHQLALDSDITPVVPAGALAQVWRGGSGRQASLAQMLKQLPGGILGGKSGQAGGRGQRENGLLGCGGHFRGGERR